jgi:hypothetical protein
MDDPIQELTQSQDADKDSNWALPVDKLVVSNISPEALNLNVNGRQLAGPMQGFGQLWQKTYHVRLSGAAVTPEEVVKVWKANFEHFWPPGNKFYAPITSISPGEVAVLNLAMPGGIKLSTGVMVIYADNVSFTFMCPEGHIFGAWITFSAFEDEGASVAQVQALVRANDPIYELSLRLGIGHRIEDKFWLYTLKSLSEYFGVQGFPQHKVSLIDPRMQWSNAKNVWLNAGVRSVLAAPVHGIRQAYRRFTQTKQ